jgi:hypothetical protein
MALVPFDVIKHIFTFVECPDKLVFNVLSKQCVGYFKVCRVISIPERPICCSIHFDDKLIDVFRQLKNEQRFRDSKEAIQKQKRHMRLEAKKAKQKQKRLKAKKAEQKRNE